MNLNYLINSVKSTLNVVGKFANNNAHTIYTVAGAATSAAAIGTSVVGTVKAVKVVEGYKEAMAYVEEASKIASPEEYTEEDKKNDIRTIRIATGVELAKCAAPTLMVAGASGFCQYQGWKLAETKIQQVTTKLGVVTAAMGGLVAQTNAYRKRVAAEVGEEKEMDLWLNRRQETVEVETVDEKTGEVKTKKKKVMVADGDQLAFFYDENNPNFRKSKYPTAATMKEDREFNVANVINTLKHADEQLEMRRIFTINDLRALFGLEPTAAGQCWGWIYRPGDPINKISAAIFESTNPATRAFINGEEDAILIVPKYCEYILDKFDFADMRYC